MAVKTSVEKSKLDEQRLLLEEAGLPGSGEKIIGHTIYISGVDLEVFTKVQGLQFLDEMVSMHREESYVLLFLEVMQLMIANNGGLVYSKPFLQYEDRQWYLVCCNKKREEECKVPIKQPVVL